MGRIPPAPPGQVSFEVVFLGHGGKELVRQGPYLSELDALVAVKELLPTALNAKSWEIRKITKAVIKRGDVVIHH